MTNPTARRRKSLHDAPGRIDPDMRDETLDQKETAMYTTKNIIVAAALSVLSFTHFGVAQASETLKPLQGISFHVGSKDAVAYFLSENGTCQLVLTMAEGADQPTRFEAPIPGSGSTTYELAEGKSLEFTCQSDTQTMKIDALLTLAGLGG